MTYQPLARKYRPQSFADLVGQDAVATALANSIKIGREPHAALFTGVRGVGKTTVARLFAKARNCEARLGNSEPCNVCESCQAITKGYHEDVLEIDGASNTGVADVRSLQETIEYVPQRSKFKIYIIDEVHMLSQAAFNALLKTLEEPPSHVIFLFATTELQKVPATILSRCQAFYLRKLPTLIIKDRLAAILKAEQISAEDRALTVIAREGHGSMRDALTLLDQALILGGGTVTSESLRPMISNLSSSAYIDLIDALLQRDAKRALEGVAKFCQEGVELVEAIEAAANLCRHSFVIQGLGREALDVGLLGLSDGELAELKGLAKSASPFDLNRIFRTLVKALKELDGSALDRYVVENYVYEWCFDPGLPDFDALLQGGGPLLAVPPHQEGARASEDAARASGKPAPSLQSMKDVISGLRKKDAASPSPQPQPQPQAAPSAPFSSESKAPVDAPPRIQGASGAAGDAATFPTTWRQLVDLWREKKPLSARKLEEVHAVAYSKERIVLAVSEQSFASKGLLQKDEQHKVREQFRELFGFTGVFQVQSLEPEVKSQQVIPETVLTERSREADDRRAKLKDEAIRAPFTQDLLQALGGTIEDVKITESRKES